MKKQIVHPISLIITIAAIIGIALLVMHARGRMAAPAAPAVTQQAAQDVCYYLNQPSKGGVGNDIAYMKITADTSKNSASGELTTELAEKDKISGTIAGTFTLDTSGTDGYILDGQYDNTGEGMSNISEQLVRFDSTEAQLGYGEMAQQADGSYGYKDKSSVTYSLSIPRVDCAKYDSLKAALQD